MKRLPLMSEMIEAFKNVKDYDISKFEFAEDLGIVKIKDFSSIKDKEKKLPFNDTYLIVFNDGTYSSLTCAEELLRGFLLELSK